MGRTTKVVWVVLVRMYGQ